MFQAVNFMFWPTWHAVDAARLLAWYAASLADHGKSYTREAAKRRSSATDVAMKVTTARCRSSAVWLHEGVPGREYMRDAKPTQIYEGTNQGEPHGRGRERSWRG